MFYLNIPVNFPTRCGMPQRALQIDRCFQRPITFASEEPTLKPGQPRSLGRAERDPALCGVSVATSCISISSVYQIILCYYTSRPMVL